MDHSGCLPEVIDFIKPEKGVRFDHAA